MPLAHAAASHVESLPLREFVTSPQKLANGLVALREILQSDALTVACGAGIELEALGAHTRWDSGMPVMDGSIAPDALAGDGLAARLATGQRFSVALEAARRLTGTRGEPLLVAGITGPGALSSELLRLGAFGDGNPDGADAIEIAGRIALETARLFLAAGCNAVVVVEPALPAESPDWSAAIATIAKLARFYEALPLVAFASDAAAAPPAAAIACPVAGSAPRYVAAGPTGIALDPDVRTWQPPATPPNVLTTCGDVRFDISIDELHQRFAALNAAPLNA